MAERSSGGDKGAGPGGEVARAHRFDTHLPVVLLHEGDELPCTAANFSRTGLLLSGRRDWPAASVFILVIKSATGDLQIPVTVRVMRRTRASPAGGPTLAVEFVDLDADRRDGIEFLVQRVIEGHAKTPDLPEIPPGTPPHEVRRLLDTVPVTLRVGLAIRAGPKDREALLHDQSAAVLESLARNPALLPLEARALAGSSHATGVALSALAVEGRFGGDEELSVQILSHAKVPPPLAERLAATLKVPALRRALAKPGLSAAARSAIQKRLVR